MPPRIPTVALFISLAAVLGFTGCGDSTEAVGGVLYVAEEERGIWRFAADAEASPTGTLIDTVGENLAADVEGLTLVKGYLIASSQGDSRFAIYKNDKFVASFRVADRGSIDGAAGTDGIDANEALNLLVVHDSKNAGGESSNYKYVRLSELLPG